MVNLMDKNKKISNMLCLVFVLSVFITLRNVEAAVELSTKEESKELINMSNDDDNYPTIEELEQIRRDIKERDKIISFIGEIIIDATSLIEMRIILQKGKELKARHKESLIKQKQQEAKKCQLVPKEE